MISYLVIASLTVSLIVILLLMVHGVRVQRNNYWLIGFLITLSYSCWVGYLMDSKLIFQFPHLIRTGTVCGYLVIPMLFLYVRSTFYPGRIWNPWYAILFVPSLFFVLDMFPFWTKPAVEKIALFEESMRSLQSLHAFSEGQFSPKGFHFLARMLWSLVWLVAILVILYRNRALLQNKGEAKTQQVYQFVGGLTALSLPFLFAHLVFTIYLRSSYTLSQFTFLLALPLLMAGAFLLFFPSVVYGLRAPVYEKATSNAGSDAIDMKTSEALEDDDVQLATETITAATSIEKSSVGEASIPKKGEPELNPAYSSQLLAYMETHKPYLNQGLTLHQLADASGIPPYLISMILNRQLGMSFNHWLNQYRVQALVERLSDPSAKNFTIESLGKASGFGSRVTLIKAFKQQMGCTPGQYVQQLQQLSGG